MQRRGLALFLFFFMPGLCMASWVTRTPAIRDRLHASTAEMGMVLFGLSLGSMGGILSSGWLRPAASVPDRSLLPAWRW